MEQKLTIILTSDRKVRIEGPLDDWLTCYGMLQEAIQIVARRSQNGEQESGLVTADKGGWRG